MAAHHVESPYHWPYETASAMERLAVSWVFEDYPDIKFITHHCGGGLVPFFGQRVRIANLRKFYNDTAVYGSTAALMCGYDYFGVEHILFGTEICGCDEIHSRVYIGDDRVYRRDECPCAR